MVGNSEPCSYGDLPGYWKPEEGHTVGTWKVFDQRCQLEVRALTTSCRALLLAARCPAYYLACTANFQELSPLAPLIVLHAV